MTGPAFLDPPEGLVESAGAASGVALTLGEAPRALVHLTLNVRRNPTDPADPGYEAVLGVDPDLAQELGRYLIAAGKAARADLARYLDTGRTT